MVQIQVGQNIFDNALTHIGREKLFTIKIPTFRGSSEKRINININKVQVAINHNYSMIQVPPENNTTTT